LSETFPVVHKVAHFAKVSGGGKMGDLKRLFGKPWAYVCAPAIMGMGGMPRCVPGAIPPDGSPFELSEVFEQTQNIWLSQRKVTWQESRDYSFRFKKPTP
jgi:hypothetical protein